MSDRVFLHYTQQELDRAYDQRAWAPNAEALIARWRSTCEQVRADHEGYFEAAYGARPEETLDIFPAPDPIGIHIHIHGGAWRAQSKEDATFLAPAMTALGTHFVVPNFGKLPAMRMPVVAEQLARSVAWTVRHFARPVEQPLPVLLSGHSSGAHMAAVLATLDWSAYGLPRDVLSAVVCISGAYDLEAVLLSARRDYIDLDRVEMAELSAPRQVTRIRCPVSVLYGDAETPEFIRQARDFAAVLETAGKLDRLVEVPGTNHFEMADALAEPGSKVHHAVAEAVASLRAAAPSVMSEQAYAGAEREAVIR